MKKLITVIVIAGIAGTLIAIRTILAPAIAMIEGDKHESPSE